MNMNKVGILGLGYVGLPLSIRFAQAGYNVTGFDIDEMKINHITQRKSYFRHIDHQEVKLAVDKGFSATTDFSHVSKMDALIICVPTPLDQHKEPDLSFVINTVNAMVPHLVKGQTVSLESTTYPGTTEEVIKPLIEAAGFTVGKNIHLVYSPEREDPGNETFSTQNIPKVIGACTPACLEKGKALYGKAINQLVPVSTTQAAELTKLLENIHRAVNIGLINEMKTIADKMDIDVYEVIRAAASKPFGFVPYYPGPGLGGHCIPIDPFYLTWKAKEFGLNSRFIELAGEINSDMPHWVVEKVTESLNNHWKSVKGSRILVLGAAYKKNVDDMRESPAVELMSLLMDKGACVDYSDPHVPKLPKMRRHDMNKVSVDITPEKLKQYDLVLLATDHDAFDYPQIQEFSACLVDTRGKFDHDRENVVAA